MVIFKTQIWLTLFSQCIIQILITCKYIELRYYRKLEFWPQKERLYYYLHGKLYHHMILYQNEDIYLLNRHIIYTTFKPKNQRYHFWWIASTLYTTQLSFRYLTQSQFLILWWRMKIKPWKCFLIYHCVCL